MTNLWSYQIEVNSTHFASFCSSKTSFDLWDQYIKDPNWAVSSPWLVFLFSCKDLLLMKKMKPRPVASDMGMCAECHLERTSITTHHNYIRERTLLHFQCSLHSGFPKPVFPAWNWLPTKRDSQLKSQKITRQKTHAWPWSIHLKLMSIHKEHAWKQLGNFTKLKGYPTKLDIKTSFDSSSGVRVWSVLCDPQMLENEKRRKSDQLLRIFSTTGDENHGKLSSITKPFQGCYRYLKEIGFGVMLPAPFQIVSQNKW